MSELLPLTVAVIGSFRKYYPLILKDWQIFSQAGLAVTSPKGKSIIEPGVNFVRFETDDPKLTDNQVQQLALHRILRADFVYAELPGGYIGRTASYEIGRVLACNRPLYCSEPPADVPVEIPERHIVTPTELVSRFRTEQPQSILRSLVGLSYELEHGLAMREYHES